MTKNRKSEDDPRFERLAELLRGTDPQRLQLLAKDSVVNFRCSETDKAEIVRVASECHVSVPEYLLWLHDIVRSCSASVPNADRDSCNEPSCAKARRDLVPRIMQPARQHRYLQSATFVGTIAARERCSP